MEWQTVDKLESEDFQRLTGVKRPTFDVILEIVRSKIASHFGRPFRLSPESAVLVTVLYWREYRTQFHLGISFGVSESTVCRTIKQVEDWLVQSGKFRLDGRKRLTINYNPLDTVIIDATETPIERPTRKQKRYYSGKKKSIHIKHR